MRRASPHRNGLRRQRQPWQPRRVWNRPLRAIRLCSPVNSACFHTSKLVQRTLDNVHDRWAIGV